MIRSKKGMLSTLDAVIFITILTIVATGMIAVPAEEEENFPDPEDICDDLFDMVLPASYAVEGSGNASYPLKELVVIAMKEDTRLVFKLIQDSLSSSVPPYCKCLMHFRYDGHSASVGYGSADRTVSSCTLYYDVAGEEDLKVTLRICRA